MHGCLPEIKILLTKKRVESLCEGKRGVGVCACVQKQ